MSLTTTVTYRRFQVALSFSGAERVYISQVANLLCQHFAKERVFYDEYYRAELARIDLDTYLQNIYNKDADLVAVFFSNSYDSTKWCGLEWRAVKNLITKRPENIVPVNMGADALPVGLFDTDGYLNATHLSPSELSADIISRYEQEFGKRLEAFLEPMAVDPGEKSKDRKTIGQLLNSSSISASYLFYIAKERVSSLFEQVDVDVLLLMAGKKDFYIPYGEPGAYSSSYGNKMTIVHQLATVLQYLENVARIGDLNEIIGQKGQLGADWYIVNAEFRAEAWNQDKPTITLTANINDFWLQLNCSKINFSGIIEENEKLFPTSTSSVLFDGNFPVRLSGLIRISAFERAANTLKGSALCLVLEPFVIQL